MAEQTDFGTLENALYERLTEKRKHHTDGVLSYGLALLERYGGDARSDLKRKYRIAAVSHDLYRGISVEELDPIVEKEGLPAPYFGNPSLAHGKLAAITLRRDYGITDEDVLNAVSYHTTGRAGMSLLEKVLYVADAAEPSRDYPGVETLRTLAETDLDRAALFSMERTILYVQERGLPLDSDTQSAAEWLNEQIQTPKKNGGTMENREIARKAAHALDAKKAYDITVLDVSLQSSFADYLIIATASNERQMHAIVSETADALAEDAVFGKAVEGRPESGWVLMDYGDVVINVFSPDMRAKYALERVWGDCPIVEF